MPTPAEKKALIFLAAVAVAGATVRATGAAARAETADDASREALRRQIVAVESAGAVARKGKGAGTSNGTSRPRHLRGNAIAKGSGISPDDPRLAPVAPPASEIDPRSIFAKPPVGRVSHKPARGSSNASPPVDVDVATAEELERLPRIGPALAERIVEDRTEHGAYGSLEGLQRVRGIGPSMARALSTYVTFSGTPRPSIAGGPGASAGTERTRKTRVRTGSAPDRHRRRPEPP